MSESLQLLLLLAGLYLLECAQWTPLAVVGFRAWLPGRWRRGSPWHAGPSWRRGALLGTPWPPLSPPLVCEPLPFAPGPAGLTLTSGQTRFVPWEKVGLVALKDCQLLLEGEPVARLATRRLTLQLGRLLRDLADLKPKPRAARLRKFLDSRWQAQACRPRLQRFRRQLALLLLSSNLLWLCIFVGLPLLLWSPLALLWLPLAGAALVSWIGCGIGFRLALAGADWLPREAWPDGSHRWLALLSPLSSLRAADLLGRELMADLEPLAVSAALLPVPRFAELARHALLDLEEQVGAGDRAGPAAEDAGWLAGELRSRLDPLLQERGLSAEALLAPPEPEDDRVRSWCPRCRSQYLHGEACPADRCGGRALQPFASAESEAEGSSSSS